MERAMLAFEADDASIRRRQREAALTGAPSDVGSAAHALLRAGRFHDYMAPHAEDFIRSVNAPVPARRSDQEHERHKQKAHDAFVKHASMVAQAAGDESRPEDHLHRGGAHAVSHMHALARLTGDRPGDSTIGGHFVDSAGHLRVSVHHRLRADGERFARAMERHYGVKPQTIGSGDSPSHFYTLTQEQRRRDRQQTESVEHSTTDTRDCGVFIPLPFNLAKQFPERSRDDSTVHITMLYAGKLTPVDYGKLVAAAASVTRLYQPFWLTLDGVDTFEHADKTVVYAVPRSQSVRLVDGKTLLPTLNALHAHMTEAARRAGLQSAHSYGPSATGDTGQKFVPHATLAYLPPKQIYTGPRPSGLFQVTQVECWGWERIQLPLGLVPPGQVASESECDDRTTGKPWLTPNGPKKRAVCVRDGGRTRIVRFGDKSLEIKRDDPARRRNFRARHGCDDPGPKTKPRYWSCRYWERGRTASQLDRGQ